MSVRDSIAVLYGILESFYCKVSIMSCLLLVLNKLSTSSSLTFSNSGEPNYSLSFFLYSSSGSDDRFSSKVNYTVAFLSKAKLVYLTWSEVLSKLALFLALCIDLLFLAESLDSLG